MHNFFDCVLLNTKILIMRHFKIVLVVIGFLLIINSNAIAQMDSTSDLSLKEFFIHKNPEYESFVRGLNESRLIDNLDQTGPYTFFIPLNVAFTDLPFGNIDVLLEEQHRDSLQKVMTAHIIAGNYSIADLTSSIKEKGGLLRIQNIGNHQSLLFKMEDERVYIESPDGIKVFLSEPEVYDSGLIYGIDKVIIPKE